MPRLLSPICYARDSLISLFRAYRFAYLPLLIAYFAHSFTGVYGMGAGMTTVPVSFWRQNELSLDPSAFAYIMLIIGLPWIAKPLLGQLVDGWTIAMRKNVLWILAFVTIGGYYLLAALAGDHAWLSALKPRITPVVDADWLVYLLGFLIVSACMCLQDAILDPLGKHIVSKNDDAGRPLTEQEYRYKVGMLQVWCRLSFNLASFTGMIAALLLMFAGAGMELIFFLAMLSPFALVAIVPAIRLPHEVPLAKRNARIILLALALLSVSIGAQVMDVPWGREISFAVTLAILITLIRSLYRTSTLSTTVKRSMLFVAITLFLVRFAPGAGDGVSWWLRQDIGFTQEFETWLGMVGSGLAALFLAMTYRIVLRGHIGKLYIALTLIGAAFGTTTLFFWHGGHELLAAALGTSPLSIVHAIAWFDTIASSPIALLGPMIMFVFLVQYAEEVGTATWMTIFAAFFNLGNSAYALTTGYLNEVFTVTRTDFSEVGALLWTSWTIGLVFPIAIVLLFLTPWRAHHEPLAYGWWLWLRRNTGKEFAFGGD